MYSEERKSQLNRSDVPGHADYFPYLKAPIEKRTYRKDLAPLSQHLTGIDQKYETTLLAFENDRTLPPPASSDPLC